MIKSEKPRKEAVTPVKKIYTALLALGLAA